MSQQHPWYGWHIGRSWPGETPLEDECPCPQEPCGLVNRENVDPECPHHAKDAAKTIRSAHAPEDCPGQRIQGDTNGD